jgi:hypothetical protein
MLPSPATVGAARQRSAFMTALLDALQDGQADTNDDCYVIMPEIMDYLRRKGFQTVTLSNLLPPPTIAESLPFV